MLLSFWSAAPTEDRNVPVEDKVAPFAAVNLFAPLTTGNPWFFTLDGLNLTEQTAQVAGKGGWAVVEIGKEERGWG